MLKLIFFFLPPPTPSHSRRNVSSEHNCFACIIHKPQERERQPRWKLCDNFCKQDETRLAWRKIDIIEISPRAIEFEFIQIHMPFLSHLGCFAACSFGKKKKRERYRIARLCVVEWRVSATIKKKAEKGENENLLCCMPRIFFLFLHSPPHHTEIFCIEIEQVSETLFFFISSRSSSLQRTRGEVRWRNFS